MQSRDSITTTAKTGLMLSTSVANDPQRQELYLSGDAFCCELEDGAVFLDQRTGKDFGVPRDQVAALRRRIRNWPGTHRIASADDADENDEITENLLRRGY